MHDDYNGVTVNEVLADDFCGNRVLYGCYTIVFNHNLLILIDVENGSTQDIDVTNLDQFLTVAQCGVLIKGVTLKQKIEPLPPKSCREGARSLIVSKYRYVGGSPCVFPVDLFTIRVTRTLESWKSARKTVQTGQNS